MGYNGSGGYTRVHNWVNDKNGAIKITASRMDAEFDDFASAMELCLLKDGQQNPTANLPMNAKKHTGVAAASARTDYADVASYQDGKFVWAGLASGASAIALTMNPTITAYTTGMRIGFVAVGDNASAVTINVDGVSAAAGVKGKNDALVATDIVSGGAYWITYKGTDGFQFDNLLEENPTFVSLTTTGGATFAGDVSVSGSLSVDNINVNGNTISSTDTAGDIVLAPDTSGNLVLDGLNWPQADGAANQIVRTDGAAQLSWETNIVIGTSQATTSGTEFDFTGLPAGIKRVRVFFSGVSLSGATDDILVQLGDAGGFETTGYVSTATTFAVITSSTAGYLVKMAGAATSLTGIMDLHRFTEASELWVASHSCVLAAGTVVGIGSGSHTLSDVLTQIRITRSGTTDTFDAGDVNIQYEL